MSFQTGWTQNPHHLVRYPRYFDIGLRKNVSRIDGRVLEAEVFLLNADGNVTRPVCMDIESTRKLRERLAVEKKVIHSESGLGSDRSLDLSLYIARPPGGGSHLSHLPLTADKAHRVRPYANTPHQETMSLGLKGPPKTFTERTLKRAQIAWIVLSQWATRSAIILNRSIRSTCRDNAL